MHVLAGATRTEEVTSDWDFRLSGTGDHITGLHPYPARFIPAIPRTAIAKHLPRTRHKSVLDPFAGCGSSLVEASYAGCSSIGVDVNGVAHLLQRAYTTRFSRAELAAVSRLGLKETPADALPTLDEALESMRPIPNLTHWFGPNAIRALAWAMGAVRGLPGQSSTAGAVAVSRVIVALSRQESDTQYRATQTDRPLQAALDRLRDSFVATAERLTAHVGQLAGRTQPRLGDARDAATFRKIKDVGLVVTSPPYPNAYEYWLYHKYRMFWMDMDPLWSRAHEIGARPFYSGSGKLGPLDFQRDMELVFANVDQVCAADARQVWVVGDSIIKGELVDNAALIRAVAEDAGWTVRETPRKVNRNRSSFQGIGRQKRESVLEMVRHG